MKNTMETDYHPLLFLSTEQTHVFLFTNNEHLTLTLLFFASDSNLQAKKIEQHKYNSKDQTNW